MKYTSTVITGQGRGKGLGFPTFNLQIPSALKLKPGIYACWVWIERKQYQGAMHFGPIPVFNQTSLSLEIFVLDYSADDLTRPSAATGSRYGQIGSQREAVLRRRVNRLTFTPIKYLRPIKNFPSSQALSNQISHDVAQIRRLLA